VTRIFPILLALAACAPTPHSAHAPAPQPTEEPAWSEPVAAPQSTPDLADPPDGVTLRLPMPGSSRAAVLAAVQDQGPGGWQEQGQATYRFHGWVRPLRQQCEDGCTWWTYGFSADVLREAELERSVYDADAEYAAEFARESGVVYDALERRLHAPPQVEQLATWADVEAADEDADTIILERRTWALPEFIIVATLEGHPGHHAGIILRVKVRAPASE